ncbi:nucleotide disphospho-sugar-binding domain-containing protein [Streptomyces sp. NPDC004232]|uniref:nucleotide disphospho-sugar-binding domain-containing protein n=1 Tax=Streptomyces sp. NPDC004232 TaxID=3154454 RepID=UPI0033B72C18
MRVLVTTWAWRSHFLSLVPLSWALRVAGHDVVVASTAGLVPTVTAAGLPAVALGKDIDTEVRQMTRWYFEWLTDHSKPVTLDDVRGRGTAAVELYRLLAETSIDDTLDFCQSWRPDLIVHDPTTFVGPLAAAVLGVPAVRHIWGMDYTYVTREFEPAALAEVCARIGLADVETLGDVTVDPCPPSLQIDTGDAVERLPMRFVPYSGPAELRPWHLRVPRRPRVVVLASSIAEPLGDGASTTLFSAVLSGLTDLDVEVLAIVEDRERALAGQWGRRVRFLVPTPLHLLLPHCDLMVHQGGGGAVMMGVAYGVPQLMLPLAADHTSNAEQLAAAGAGLWMYARSATPQTVSAQASHLLSDGHCHERARELRAEMDRQPSAARVVESLEDLVGAWEGR